MSLFWKHLCTGCGRKANNSEFLSSPLPIRNKIVDHGDWPWVASIYYLGKKLYINLALPTRFKLNIYRLYL